eukprot:11547886-Alexandrium_andersonii.AAC.1
MCGSTQGDVRSLPGQWNANANDLVSQAPSPQKPTGTFAPDAQLRTATISGPLASRDRTLRPAGSDRARAT